MIMYACVWLESVQSMCVIGCWDLYTVILRCFEVFKDGI
jgi:hypothetical protein